MRAIPRLPRPALPGRHGSAGLTDAVKVERALGMASAIWSPLLRDLHDRWQAVRGFGLLPPPARFPPDSLPGAEHIAEVAVERCNGRLVFRIRQAGQALVARAGRPLAGELLASAEAVTGEDPLGNAAWAYRRSVETRLPTYEYGHFMRSGEEPPLLFERLLLPLGQAGQAERVVAATLFRDSED